jgi:hypothetical protein
MRSSERGATAVIVAIVLAVLCGFVALSLDVGHLLSVRGELQNGADAAALAGAKRLNGTNLHFELSGARVDATNYARNHPTDQYDVEPTTIELGAWLPPARACAEVAGVQTGATGSDGHKFCAISGNTEADAANINAVRVVTRRQGTPGETGGGAVPLAFGAFVGKNGPQEVGAEAIAVTGGPCSQKCPELPIAIRAGCLYDQGRIKCDGSNAGNIYYIGLASAGEDSAGLTSLSDTVSANANAACDILRTQDGCKPIDAGVPINVQDGNDWVAACDYGCPYQAYGGGGEGDDGIADGETAGSKNDKVCEVIRKRADRNCDGKVDDANGDGVPDYRAQVPVIQYDNEAPEFCDGNYNQSARIVGWATVAIVSARCETDKKLPFGAAPITKICDDFATAHGDFSASTCVAVQLYCNQTDDEVTRAGCLAAGTSALPPVLVR